MNTRSQPTSCRIIFILNIKSHQSGTTLSLSQHFLHLSYILALSFSRAKTNVKGGVRSTGFQFSYPITVKDKQSSDPLQRQEDIKRLNPIKQTSLRKLSAGITLLILLWTNKTFNNQSSESVSLTY